MPHETYSNLVKEMPRISKVVNEFKSETVQQAAFELLVSCLGLKGEPDEGAVDEKAGGGAPKKKRKSAGAKPARGEGASTDPDPVQIANQIKQRQDFDKIEQRILHARDVWDKIRLVLLIVNEPLTSGSIAEVLSQFKLKTDITSVSRTLTKNRGSLAPTGRVVRGGRPGYELTGPARRRAEKWLNETLK